MIVMVSNSTWAGFHIIARETRRLGHLYSPGGAERGPYPWFPYALDNGAFSCWDQESNTFDFAKWEVIEPQWHQLLAWAASYAGMQEARWAIVPDIPGNAEGTLERWHRYAPVVQAAGIPLAIAVQDGMTPDDVRALSPLPSVIAIGGTDAFKWGTLEGWCEEFKGQVHVLRCNSPAKLDRLMRLGVLSCDGTGWNMGSAAQTDGLEEWARRHAHVPSKNSVARYFRQKGELSLFEAAALDRIRAAASEVA